MLFVLIDVNKDVYSECLVEVIVTAQHELIQLFVKYRKMNCVGSWSEIGVY